MLIVAGGGLLGYVAGELIVEDTAIIDWVHAHAPWLDWAAPDGRRRAGRGNGQVAAGAPSAARDELTALRALRACNFCNRPAPKPAPFAAFCRACPTRAAKLDLHDPVRIGARLSLRSHQRARCRGPLAPGHGAHAQRGRDLRRRAPGLAILADGMGGYNAGEVASGIAVNVIKEGLLPELASGRDLSKVDIHTGLTHAALLLQQQIAAANKGIYEAAQNRPECAGMGTTVVAAVFHGTRVSIAHIGDSRCYRLRGETFRAAHARSLAAAGADRQRPDHGRPGALLAQQEPRHARARHRGDRSGRHRRIPRRAGRHLSAVFRRPHRHGRHRGRAWRRRRKARRRSKSPPRS